MCTWPIWGWIDVEARRILGSRVFLAVLAGLLVLNIFFFYYQRSDTQGTGVIDGDVYHAQMESLQGQSWETAKLQCETYLAQVYESISVGNWDYQSPEERVRAATEEILEQYTYLLNYDTYLDNVQAQAKLLQSVSLFSDPDSIAFKNTVKTAEDFAKMQDVEITAGHDMAVTEFFADKWSDYSILIVICVVCGLLLAERKEGLWPMIHATSGGRRKMAVQRTLILLAAAWLSTLVLVGSRIVLCGLEYHGLGEWGRSIQSISMFQNVPTPMTVGQFWLFYMTVKAMGAFWIGLVLWAVLSSISNLGLALSVAGLVMGGEFACTAIPSSSMFALLRYVNVFSYVDFSTVFTRYLNLNVFGKLVAGSDLVLAMLPLLCIVFIAVNMAIAQRKYPVAPQNRLLRWFDGVARRTDPVLAGGGEPRKLLIKRRGLLLLILLGLLLTKTEAPPREYVAWDPFIQFYEAQYAGPITEGKIEQLETALDNCQDEYNRRGLEIVLEQAQSARDGAWILPTAPYDAIWSNNEENYHRNTALLAMLILVLLLAPIASQERQNDMTILLRSTSGGRKRLVRRKQLLLVAMAALVWTMVYGTELYRTVEVYGGFACLSAPAYSVPIFHIGLPLWAVLGLYYLAKLLVLVAVGEACYFLSGRCAKNRDATLLCCGILLIPAALGAIGSVIGEYLSFLLPLGGVELFR